MVQSAFSLLEGSGFVWAVSMARASFSFHKFSLLVFLCGVLPGVLAAWKPLP